MPLKASSWSWPLNPPLNLQWTWQGWLVQERGCSLECAARRTLLVLALQRTQHWHALIWNALAPFICGSIALLQRGLVLLSTSQARWKV